MLKYISFYIKIFFVVTESKNMSFYDKVYEKVRLIPNGKVATYGQIALLCCSPRASRAVGYALHCNPLPGIIPCHRVVNREGRLALSYAFGGAFVQKALLASENVFTDENDIVDLKLYLWDGKS
jgi:methylated-DNA-protein-cysteine methyltransferase-like protein